jgi:hypothetical protein
MKSDDLEAHKMAVEDRIDSLGSWMIGFIWPVAVGLFIEFYAILNLAWTHDWNVIIDRIGLLLVTAGVSGELAIEQKKHSAERKLRRINADIDRESDLALKTADERIAELNLKAEQEQRERLKLQFEIKVAEQRAVRTAILTQEEMKRRRPQRT